MASRLSSGPEGGKGGARLRRRDRLATDDDRIAETARGFGAGWR